MIKTINWENILIFFWLCILVSINSNYSGAIELQNINNISFFSQTNFFTLLNFIRFFIPYILLPILIIVFFSVPIKKPNVFITTFAIFWCFQLFAFFISNRHLESLETFPEPALVGSTSILEYEISLFTSLNLIFSSLSILLIISIAKNLNLKEFNKKILIVTLCFVGLIAVYFTFNIISETIGNNLKFAYWTNTLHPMELTMGQANPRITGISRMILIFYLLFFCFLLNNNKKIIWYIILIILGLVIYKMQARGSLIGIITLYFIFFVFCNLNFRKKIVIFFILIAIPILSFEIYYYKIKPGFDKINVDKINVDKINVQPKNRFLLIESSSGRNLIWDKAILVIKEKKILLGYGPQADRFLLTQLKKNKNKEQFFREKYGINYLFDSNVSNSFLYAYLCSGIIGILLLIFIYLLAIKKVLKNIFIKKIFLYKNILKNFSTITLVYLGFRGLFENSFSVFGIDYIFFILTYLISENSEYSSQKI